MKTKERVENIRKHQELVDWLIGRLKSAKAKGKVYKPEVNLDDIALSFTAIPVLVESQEMESLSKECINCIAAGRNVAYLISYVNQLQSSSRVNSTSPYIRFVEVCKVEPRTRVMETLTCYLQHGFI